MSPERLEQIQSLYLAALDQPPAERADFLDEACADDADLHHEVTSLLAADTGDNSLFDHPLANVQGMLDGGETQLPPQHVGPYRIVEKIGRGGMGAVYLAARDDGQFEQQVALKVIRHGLDTEEIVQRFLQERQILARLQHPHIARLYDGGIDDDGRPYFAMEHVAGEPLTTYCDQHQLEIEARLQLFAQVGDAVQFAHRNLIVHRDLKPSNILVTEDAKGNPSIKLLDFGIAKALEEETPTDGIALTQTGARVLTPEYASPEQLTGDPLTTATDVYSMGVVLYELLTGHRPYRFERTTLGAVGQVVRETEPVRPSTAVSRIEERHQSDGTTKTLTPEAISRARSTEPARLRRRLAGDLDTITLKALRKEPDRRYASAEAFVEDIKRYLAGLPVEARPDTVGYRLRKFVRRHRAGIVTTATLLLLIITFGIIYTVRVTAERNEAEARQAQAEAAFTFLTDILKGADPNQTGGNDMTARDLLDEGTRRAMRELEDNPGLRAAVLHAIGEVYSSLDEMPKADSLLTEALQLRETHYGPTHPETGKSLLMLGRIRLGQARYDAADSLFRRAETAFAAEEHAAARAQILSRRAFTASQQRKTQEADSLLRLTIALRRQVLPPDHPDLAESLVDLAYEHMGRREWAATDSLLREALTIRRRHFGEVHNSVATTVNNLGYLAMRRGDFVAADSFYTEALRISRLLYGEPHSSVASKLLNRGSLRRRQGHLEEAEIDLRKALEQFIALKGSEHPETATVMNNLAGVLRQLNRFDDAETLYKTALETRRATLGDDDPLVATSLNNIALLNFSRGRYDNAEAHLREALRRWQESIGPTHKEIAAGLHNLARTLAAQGRSREAEATFRDALAMRRATLAEQDPGIAQTLEQLADLLQREDRLPEACPLYKEAETIYSKVHGPDHADTITVRQALETC